MELVEALALDELPGEAQLARSGGEATRPIGDDHAVGLALGRRVEEQGGEVARVVRDRAERAAAQRPIAEAEGGEKPVIEVPALVPRPFRTEIAPPLDFGREIFAAGEDDRLRLAAALVLHAPEWDDLDILRRPPARDGRGAERAALAAMIELLPIHADAGGHPQRPGDGKLRVDFRTRPSEGADAEHIAGDRLRSRQAQRKVGHAGRRRKRIALRREADAHVAAGDQALIEVRLIVEIHAVDADVAGLHGTEAARAERRIEADPFVADACAERVVG